MSSSLLAQAPLPKSWLLNPCFGGCLKRFNLVWLTNKSSSTIIIEPDPEPESIYEELESGLLNVTGTEEESFYDARSEASEELRRFSKSSKFSEPNVARFVSPKKASNPRNGLSTEVLEVSQRLESLLSIRNLCHSGKTSGTAIDKEGKSMNIQVETLMRSEAQMWLCHVEKGVDIGCSSCCVHGVTVAEVSEALQNPQQRLQWDSANFRAFEQLTVEPTGHEDDADDADPPGGTGRLLQQDIIYCVMPAPGMLTDREVLQKRWRVSMEEGEALIMESITDHLLRPESPKHIRAQTRLSGYLLRRTGEAEGRLEITAISQTDLGGSIPAWVQSQGRRLAKNKLAPWAKKLEDHCRAMRFSGADSQ